MTELIQLLSIFWQPIAFIGSGAFLFKHLWGISTSLEKNYSEKVNIIRKRKIVELGIQKTEFCNKALPVFDLNDEGDKPRMAEINFESSNTLVEFRKKIQETLHWDDAITNLVQKTRQLSYISLAIAIVSAMVGFCLDVIDWNILPVTDIISLLAAVLLIDLFLIMWLIFFGFFVCSIIFIEKNTRKWENEYLQRS